MSVVAAAIAAMREKGVDPSDILDIVEAIAAAEIDAYSPVRTARQDRNARYYAKMKAAREESGERLNKTPQDAQQDAKTPPPLVPPPNPPGPLNTPPYNPPHQKDLLVGAKAEFEVWYRGYPHKVGKAAAAKAFTAARRKADLQTLIDGRDRYVRTKPPDRPWCNPATWLNQDRWTDEPSTDNHQSRRSSPGHHQGQSRGFDAVLSGMARVAHQRGLTERERDERLDEAAGSPEFIDADWRATGSH